MRVCIHGLGYVGLTALVHFTRAGVDVVGYDPAPDVAAAVREGRAKRNEALAYLFTAELPPLEATEAWDVAAAPSRDVHLIAVPSERQGEPTMVLVQEVLTRLWMTRREFPTTILIESTLTPGCVDQWLDAYPAVHLALARERAPWHLAVCPRRDWFADKRANLATLVRVVGGVNERSTFAAERVLEAVMPASLLRPTTHRTAELVKPMENALLHTPVMLAHQLALQYPEHDVVEALELVGTHWRLPEYYLGIGTGGRCVPLGGKYLQEGAALGARPHPSLLETSQWAERQIREAVVAVVEGPRLARGTVAVCGVAYRPQFRDAGGSAGVWIARALQEHGHTVWLTDPMWTLAELEAMVPHVEAAPLAVVQEADTIVIATAHDEFDDIPRLLEQKRRARLLIDGPGRLEDRADALAALHVTYRRVGRPGWRRQRPGH